MHRIITPLLLGLAITTTQASAALFEFDPGTVPTDDNPLTIVGSPTFEVSDVPNPAPNDFQFNAISPIDVQVVANDGTLPVDFTLTRLATANNRLNMIFNNPTYSNLVLWFDIAGLSKGDAIPSGTIVDDDGVVSWNAPGLTADTEGNFVLAGSLEGASLNPEVVPEPTGLAGIFAAAIGLVHFLRRR